MSMTFGNEKTWNKKENISALVIIFDSFHVNKIYRVMVYIHLPDLKINIRKHL